MFKRMSVLCRRPSDSRDEFARGWLAHGRLVSRLRNIRGYLQNRIVEDIAPGTLRADGFVELWFDTPAAMAEAFAGPGAPAVTADEPNFLGHATGYALNAASPLRLSPPGAKLVCAAADPRDLEGAVALARSVPDARVEVDDVDSIIPKPGMSLPPQAVGCFVHVRLPDAGSARALGQALAATAPETVAIFRVDTHRQV